MFKNQLYLDVVGVEIDSAKFVPVAEDNVRCDRIITFTRKPIRF